MTAIVPTGKEPNGKPAPSMSPWQHGARIDSLPMNRPETKEERAHRWIREALTPAEPVQAAYQKLSKSKNTGGVFSKTSVTPPALTPIEEKRLALARSRENRETALMIGDRTYIKAIPCKKFGGVEYYVSAQSCVACACARRPIVGLTKPPKKPTRPPKKRQGWRLTRAAFEREYEAMKKEGLL
jgi:hypothetical protein